MRTSRIHSSYILKEGKRFEGKYYLNDNSLQSMCIETAKFKTIELGQLANVFNPPVFKRQFCSDTPRAVQYFQSSDVQMAAEKSPVFVFKEQAESLILLVKKNDILVTGFGTIGNTRLVSSLQDGTCYANNVCRIRPYDKASLGYIYAFLSSKYGYAQLNKNASGSVVRYIEAPGIKKTLIPELSDNFKAKVGELILESARLREESMNSIAEAQHLIEVHFPLEPESENNGLVSSKTILTTQLHRFEAAYHLAAGKHYDEYIRQYFPWKSLGEVSQSISRPGIVSIRTNTSVSLYK